MGKTFFFTILFWVGVLVIPGCDDCKCPPVSTVDQYADIIGVATSASRKPLTASGSTLIRENEKVSWIEIDRISLYYTTRTYGHWSVPETPFGRWATAVYACDCNSPGYLGSQEKLTSITVKTAFDFDATHPAGSVINELTLITANAAPNKIALNDYVKKGPFPYNEVNYFDLVLTRSPAAKGPFALDVTVELDNGEVYTTRTPVIELI